MSKSNAVRMRDVLAATALVGECLELWADPDAWRVHLLRGACRLTGQAVGHYIEMGTPRPPDPLRLEVLVDFGWRDDACRDYYCRYVEFAKGLAEPHPGMFRLMDRVMAHGRAAALRGELCDDADWYRGEFFNDFRKPAYNDGLVVSVIRDGGRDSCSYLSVHQDVADAPPTVRTRRLLVLVHRQVAPLVRTRLATQTHRSVQGLTPRLRATLDRLLTQDSEKQIARFLEVQNSTAHEYVGKVYRHFGVDSRSGLMAYFLDRVPAEK